MKDEMVLVTSAAGGAQGQTGRHVTEKLLAKGVAVRAFVHRLDERSEHLRRLGAEVFVGDFLDIHSVRRAVQGVSSVYFAYPVQAGLLDATAIMAFASREAGIARLVNLVMLQSSPDAPTSTHAAELSFRASVRMGRDRRRACQGDGVLREPQGARPPEPGDARRDPLALGRRKHACPARRSGRRRRRRRRVVDRPNGAARRGLSADRRRPDVARYPRRVRPRPRQGSPLRGDLR